MRLAATVTIDDGAQTRRFAAEEFRAVMRSCNFMGGVAFWRALEKLAALQPRTRTHARGLFFCRPLEFRNSRFHVCDFDRLRGMVHDALGGADAILLAQ
jgi:hypothetical protein